MNAGYSGGAPFEYVIAEKKTGATVAKKVFFVFLYILWGTAILTLGVTTRLFVYLIALVPMTTWILVYFTWRFTCREYEYSFFQGVLTLTRVYGGKTRIELAKIRLKTLEQFLPANEENGYLVDRIEADKILHAESSSDAENLYAMAWKEESGKTVLLFAELNERAQKIVQFYRR